MGVTRGSIRDYANAETRTLTLAAFDQPLSAVGNIMPDDDYQVAKERPKDRSNER